MHDIDLESCSCGQLVWLPENKTDIPTFIGPRERSAITGPIVRGPRDERGQDQPGKESIRLNFCFVYEQLVKAYSLHARRAELESPRAERE